MSTVQPEGAAHRPVPGIWRRMACFVYEGMLLFGVVMISAYLFSSLTQQRHALQGRHGLQAFLFVVLGIYFVFFWSRSGQTLAMKAWRLRLVDNRTGRPLSQGRALLRFVVSWVWFLPALASGWLGGLSAKETAWLALIGIIVWATMARWNPSRQFWHDHWVGSQFVDATIVDADIAHQ
jgi:uncharacterized RDD family membrane protein YckC